MTTRFCRDLSPEAMRTMRRGTPKSPASNPAASASDAMTMMSATRSMKTVPKVAESVVDVPATGIRPGLEHPPLQARKHCGARAFSAAGAHVTGYTTFIRPEELADYQAGNGAVTIRIRESGATKYRTLFIGRGGRVLQESIDNPATYRVRGTEGYVRARVIDSKSSSWVPKPPGKRANAWASMMKKSLRVKK